MKIGGGVMNIGMEIKKLRTEKGITLKELSEKSELSVGFLSQLERGLTTIAVDSLEKLADILEVHLTHFFDYPLKRKDMVLRSYEQELMDSVEGGVHMDSNIAHNWANYTNKKVKLIAVNTPNYIYNSGFHTTDAD